ncbi:hypothetical protein BMS3Abin07_00221 [bacterium BMS3Abin07]|nr:hypothetical protein BMS3Abin07_00221 [bacterium BMS3Abin07]GBE31365.1 hypothetical protein BMS3Bbin05_00265 [bacterium BMS3Bbin05]HDL20311.1 hypothetical protein [Nitrospirota bacterium]HDZ88630.1 hypothetical protein [Nitrospirota bacterium]
MITFTKKYHEPIQEGKITLMFRPWDTLKVLRGKIYRAYNLGLIKVLDVDFKKISDITLEEVKQCGYRDMDEFREDYGKIAKRKVDFETERAVRIEFGYIGEDIENYKKAMGDVKDSEIFTIKEKLLKLEQKGRKQWAIKALMMLRKREYVLPKDMEKPLKMPPEAVKKNMKKLKTLNLIMSNNRMGYSITPLGMKILKSLNKV